MYLTSIGDIDYLKNYNSFKFSNNNIIKTKKTVFITNDPRKINNIKILSKNKHSPLFNTGIDNLFLITENEFNNYKQKINLINDYDKIFISSCYVGFGHFILDTLGLIFQSIENVKNPFLIININKCLVPGEDAKKFIFFLKKCLKKYNIPYIFLKNNYAIAVNNFYKVSWMEHSDFLYNKIYEISQNFVKNNNNIKQNKVYIQTKSKIKNINLNELNADKLIEYRMFNESYLEDFLKENDFDIITPSDFFKSIEEQIQYFNNTKTIMSATASGLVNSLFMKPGNNVIELMSPMSSFSKDPFYRLHSSQYQDMSYARNHNYFSKKSLIDGKLIVEDIKNNPKFLEMIK